MKSAAVLALGLAASVSAHGLVTTIKLGSEVVESYNPFEDPYKNPVPQRIVWAFPEAGNGPVVDVTSRDIVCNIGATPAPISATVAAGSPIQFQWTDWMHIGPSMTYLANCNGDCSTVDPTTLSFFKIQHAGLENGRWASELMVAAGNVVDATIPADIAPGNYILRHELVALHEADALNGAQFYPMCANLVITGSGTAKPPGVKFPGAYKPTDRGILVDMYNDPEIKASNYIIPGPAVYTGGAGGSQTTTPVPETETETPETEPETSEPVPGSTVPTSPSQPTVVKPSPKPSTHPKAPKPALGVLFDRNRCLDEVNACIRNAQSNNGGDVSAGIARCEQGRNKCEKLARRFRVRMARR